MEFGVEVPDSNGPEAVAVVLRLHQRRRRRAAMTSFLLADAVPDTRRYFLGYAVIVRNARSVGTESFLPIRGVLAGRIAGQYPFVRPHVSRVLAATSCCQNAIPR